MNNLKDVMVKLFKMSPLVLVLIVVGSDVVMHLTAGYMITPAKWDDIVYMIAQYVSDAGKEALQACSLTIGQ